MNAIQTTYKNRLYRSRLEARWAAFFDLVGWKFEYEPYDLNGWIPDFVLIGKERWGEGPQPSELEDTEILVEVKPYLRFEDFDTDKITRAMEATEKWGKEILLLGATIFEDDFHRLAVGWLGQDYSDLLKDPEDIRKAYAFTRAPLIASGKRQELGFCHEEGSFHNRITGEYVGGDIPDPTIDVRGLWNRAGNTVQWRSPRRREKVKT